MQEGGREGGERNDNAGGNKEVSSLRTPDTRNGIMVGGESHIHDNSLSTISSNPFSLYVTEKVLGNFRKKINVDIVVYKWYIASAIIF